MNFIISDIAASKIKELAASRGTPDVALRVEVKGGGCSGMYYNMEWCDTPKDKDKVFTHEQTGAKVIVDGKSMLYLNGSQLVYEESLMATGFSITNPNAKSQCGCGESFSV
jgi:iron-sulfur cluster assembly protein